MSTIHWNLRNHIFLYEILDVQQVIKQELKSYISDLRQFILTGMVNYSGVSLLRCLL